MRFHAVMIDETGCEFGASVSAPSREAARAKLAAEYPESHVDQLESPADARRRERDMQARINREYGWEY